MPLPMVHLGVALRVLELIGKPTTCAVLTGSLAPDAIHMRYMSNRQDKNLTHIKHHELNSLDEALECLKKHYAIADRNSHFNPIESIEVRGKSGFELGYFIHCVTDYLWYFQVYVKFRETFKSDETDSKIKSVYYREAEYIDFWMFTHLDWVDTVWNLLTNCTEDMENEYVSYQEVKQWNEHILHCFDQKTKADYPVSYIITLDQVDEFIINASECIISLLNQSITL